VTEAEFQAQVRDRALRCGWLYYHTHDSRRSDAGFPDTILIKNGMLIAAECKVEGRKATLEQIEWLKAFDSVRVTRSYIWRPEHLDEITTLLGAKPEAKTADQGPEAHPAEGRLP